MSKIVCAEPACGNVMCLDDAVEQRLRETHAHFYCPMGHSNYFPGKTEDEKKIESLERTIGHLKNRVEYRDDIIERMQVAAGRCPWPGCEFHTEHVTWNYGWDLRPLAAHLRASHGMPTVASVRGQAEAS